MYTDPVLAQKFVNETHIDALACSFGTAHGFYTEAPKLDFPRIAKIRELCKIPLVMHGGSGVNQEDYKKAIQLCIDDFDENGELKTDLKSDEATLNLANALGKERGKIKKGSNKNPIAQARKKELEKQAKENEK